jgi:hypothetical protein
MTVSISAALPRSVPLAEVLQGTRKGPTATQVFQNLFHTVVHHPDAGIFLANHHSVPPIFRQVPDPRITNLHLQDVPPARTDTTEAPVTGAKLLVGIDALTRKVSTLAGPLVGLDDSVAINELVTTGILSEDNEASKTRAEALRKAADLINKGNVREGFPLLNSLAGIDLVDWYAHLLVKSYGDYRIKIELSEMLSTCATDDVINLLRRDVSDDVKSAAASSLRSHQNDHAKQALIDVLTSNANYIIKYAAANSLRKHQGDDVKQALINVLTSDVIHDDVKLAAAYSLNDHQGDDIYQALMGVLSSDAGDYVKSAAISSLNDDQGDDVKQDLINVLTSDASDAVKLTAAHYLRGPRVQGDDAKQALMAVLTSDASMILKYTAKITLNLCYPNYNN